MKYSILYIFLIAFSNQNTVSQNSQKEVLNAFNKGQSNHYINKDSAYFYYEEALRLADKNSDLSYMLSSFMYLINANGRYYDLANYKKNIEREELFLLEDKRLDTFPDVQFYKDYLLYDKGNYHYKLKQYANSKKYFQELLNKIEAIPIAKRSAMDITLMSSSYSFLGLIYHHTNKYELAAYTFKKQIDLLHNSKDRIADWESPSNNSKKLLSLVYKETKNFNEANRILEEVLTFYKSKQGNPRYKNNILSTYLIASKNYNEQGLYEPAIQKLDEASRYNFRENPFTGEFDLVYGDSYLGLNNYEKAITYYNNSLNKALEKYNEEKHQDVATAYAKFGKLYMTQKKIKEGLHYYQLALIQFEKEFNSTNFVTNPNPINVDDKTAFIEILREKLEALNTSYSSTNEVDFLQMAHSTSKTIIHTLDVLRPEFESKLDKQFLINETYPSFQTAVSIAYKLYNTTKDAIYIDDAFYFMEKSKSISLLEAHRNAEATKYGGVPDEILTKEQEFRATISHLEQQVFKASSQEIQSLSDTLSSVKNNYYAYIDTIEKDFATYYAMKYKPDVVSLNEMQRNLLNDQALLSYLSTEENLFLVVIDGQKKEFLKLPFNENIRNTIKNVYRNSSELDINNKSIYKDSYAVYKAILEPGLQGVNASDLIILPDDVLYYVPFDALTTGKKSFSFLINTHTISYANSATLYLEQLSIKKQKNNQLLVVAPSFDQNNISASQQRADMGPLLYNTKEADNIANFFKATIFRNNEASINRFRTEVNSYNLLHFATHASANDEYPDYSYLAFSRDSTNSNLLYVKDIYNYQFNADMATLSACQTGIGKLQKGEGMLSLARAFNYAGVPSIVTTLWKINDQSTSDIMHNFYENLSEGLNKKEALRQAKIKYLATNADDPFLQHPYYWSGIVINGNTLPLIKNNYVLWFFIGVIGLIIFLFLTKKSLKFF